MIKPKPGRPPPGLVLPTCLLRRRQRDNISLIALGQSRRGAAPARSRPTVRRMPEAGRGLTSLRLNELLSLPACPPVETGCFEARPLPVRLCAFKLVRPCLLVQAAVNHQIAGSHNYLSP